MNTRRGRTATRATRTRRAVLAAVGALVAVVASTGFASSPAATGESVASFDAVVDVDARGDLHVTETIAYVFGGAPRHGLRRELQTRGDAQDRARPVSGVTASSPSGAPSQVQVTDVGGLTVLRVGDPERTVGGRHTYVLRYTVAGAVDRVTTSPTGPPTPHDELTRDVTGSGWDVPIDRVSVLVTAPRAATAAACHRGPAGPAGSCAGVPGPVTAFSTGSLAPGQGFTVTVAYPPGTATSPATPPSDGPGASPAASRQPGFWGRTVGYVLLLASAAAVVVFGLWSLTRAAADSRATAASRSRPSTAAAPLAPSRATPDPADPRAPGGLRPGQLATLRDGRADPVALTATLVDLAVRGFLRIRAVPGTGGRRMDWLLIAASPPPDDRLLPYEETLREAVLAEGDSILLSNLHRRHLRSVRRELVTDAVEHGLLRDPDADEHFLRRVLRALDADAPLRRTPAGDALVEEMARFRAELATIHPDGRAEDDARTAFGRWLPHAVVLDMAQDWADRFRLVVRERHDIRWYARSRRIADAGADDAADVPAGVVAFTAAACDAVTSDPGASGSGGFGHSGGFGYSDGFGGSSSSDSSSGGGGGGGSSGGGSW